MDIHLHTGVLLLSAVMLTLLLGTLELPGGVLLPLGYVCSLQSCLHVSLLGLSALGVCPRSRSGRMLHCLQVSWRTCLQVQQ